MDEHRETAIEVRAKIAKAVFEDKVSSRDIDEVEYKIIEDALRSTASKSEKDGWNKAVEECAKIVERGHITIDGVSHPFRLDDIALTLRRLIMEDGK